MAKHIHLIGIGGTGMGPLAKVLLEMGCQVSGSDLAESDTTQLLKQLGAEIYFNHRAENINGAESVVYSSAIASDNPELAEARRRGIPTYHRSEMWAELINSRRGIAIGGAHGKTTITSMISWILERSGYDPTVLIGARFAPFGPGAKYGSGEFVVAEADESDRSFLRYFPEICVVTSIEADHLENYNGAFQELVRSYREFIANCKNHRQGHVVLGVDDPTCRSLLDEIGGATTYGWPEGADYRAVNARVHEGTSFFELTIMGEPAGIFELVVPGRHNISNALAAIAVCQILGVESDKIASALKSFSGANRRFQVIGEAGGVLVVDDYAHHPTEIRATLSAAREGWKRRIVAIFQPHRFSRTQLLMDSFAEAFDQADLVVITDIYAPPPEKPIKGVSGAVLAEKVAAHGQEVAYVPHQKDLLRFLEEHCSSNDLVITMGAGSIWKTAYEFYDLLRLRNG